MARYTLTPTNESAPVEVEEEEPAAVTANLTNATSNETTEAAPATAAMFESNVAVAKNIEGGSKSEIWWKVSCDGDFNLINAQTDSYIHTAPYDATVSLPACTSCTVSMKDSYGDGWQGNTWAGFGQTYTGPVGTNRDTAWYAQSFTTGGCAASESDAADSADAANDTTSVVSSVTVTGGSWKQEVRWSISCGNQTIVDEDVGRAPYSSSVTLPSCSACTLNMRDTQ